MKSISPSSLRTSTLLLASAAAWVYVSQTKAGDAGPQGNGLPLFPGYDQTLSLPTGAAVEVRRATAVLDPHDPTRLSAGSLWKEGLTNEDGMFADRRARHRGDILTLVVVENATVNNSLDQQTSKANSVASPLDQFVLKLPKNPPIARPTGDITPGSLLALTNSYKGNAQLNQQQSLTTRAAVTVTDVLPNGNLVFEGCRTITFAGETKYAELHGIVRRDDVAPDNTVLSSNVSDAKIQFLSAGSLTDAQKKGWLSRGLDRFNPL